MLRWGRRRRARLDARRVYLRTRAESNAVTRQRLGWPDPDSPTAIADALHLLDHDRVDPPALAEGWR